MTVLSFLLRATERALFCQTAWLAPAVSHRGHRVPAGPRRVRSADAPLRYARIARPDGAPHGESHAVTPGHDPTEAAPTPLSPRARPRSGRWRPGNRGSLPRR